MRPRCWRPGKRRVFEETKGERRRQSATRERARAVSHTAHPSSQSTASPATNSGGVSHSHARTAAFAYHPARPLPGTSERWSARGRPGCGGCTWSTQRKALNAVPNIQFLFTFAYCIRKGRVSCAPSRCARRPQPSFSLARLLSAAVLLSLSQTLSPVLAASLVSPQSTA